MRQTSSSIQYQHNLHFQLAFQFLIVRKASRSKSKVLHKYDNSRFDFALHYFDKFSRNVILNNFSGIDPNQM